MNLLGQNTNTADFYRGGDNGADLTFAPPDNNSAGSGQNQQFSGDRDQEGGLSLAGLSGVLAQAAKVVAITIFVIVVKAVLGLFKRRRKPASMPAT